MSDSHPIKNLMESTMENLKDMIDVNTVVGDAIETKDGGYIVPISKVSFGFTSGGSEFPDKTAVNRTESTYPFGGGSGAAVSVKPVAFLVVKNDIVRLLPVDQDTTYDRIVDAVPQVIDVVKDLFKKSDCSKKKETEEECFDSTNCSSNLEK